MAIDVKEHLELQAAEEEGGCYKNGDGCRKNGNGDGSGNGNGGHPTGAPRADGLPRRRFLKPLALADDEELVDQVRRGNERAFETMHQRYAPGLLSFVRHSLGSQEDAEDAIQQTFFKAYRSMRGSRNAIQLKPWLYTIARNECVSIIRRRSIRPADPYEEDSGPSTIGLSEQVENREELRETLAAISRLPEEQRQALILTSLGTLSGDEIGRVLGCDRAKIKSLVFRARTTLAKAQEARDTSCEEIRAQLSELHGGALRRKVLREHLLECDGCREFQLEVRRQRQLVAALLPVTPLGVAKVAGLLSTLGGGGALAGGGAAVSGGSAALAGSGIGAGAAGFVVAAALSIGTIGHPGGAERQAEPPSRNSAAVEIAYGSAHYGQGFEASTPAGLSGLTQDAERQARKDKGEGPGAGDCRRECGARGSGGIAKRPGGGRKGESGAGSPGTFALGEPQQAPPAEVGLTSNSGSSTSSARSQGGPPSGSSGGGPAGQSGGKSSAGSGGGASGQSKGGPPGQSGGEPPGKSDGGFSGKSKGNPPGQSGSSPGKSDSGPPGKSGKRHAEKSGKGVRANRSGAAVFPDLWHWFHGGFCCGTLSRQ